MSPRSAVTVVVTGICCALMAALGQSAQAGPSFIGLDPAAGAPVGISDDGRTVLLNNTAGPSLWRAGVGLSPLPGDPPGGTQATAISGNGMAFGLIDTPSMGAPLERQWPGWLYNAALGQTIRLDWLAPPPLPGWRVSDYPAYPAGLAALSLDGQVATGSAADPSAAPDGIILFAPRTAFRWTVDGGAQWLAALPGDYGSRAVAMSADGSVIVGTSGAPSLNSFEVGDVQAVRWLADGVPEPLTDVPSESRDVSADGRTVLMTVHPNPFLAFSSLALWAEGGASTIIRKPSGKSIFLGGGVRLSGDASTVTASLYDPFLTTTNYSYPGVAIWTRAHGWQLVADLLVDLGVFGLDGWQLTTVTDISYDGRTLVGVGQNPSGQTAAWIATIPEPSLATCLIAGALFAAMRRDRRRAGRE